jgi:hypothetical protein
VGKQEDGENIPATVKRKVEDIDIQDIGISGGHHTQFKTKTIRCPRSSPGILDDSRRSTMRYLYHILEDFHVVTRADFKHLTKRHQQSFLADLHELYLSRGPEILAAHKQKDGVRLFMNTYNTRFAKFDMICKKSILYGGSTVVSLDFPLYYVNDLEGRRSKYYFPNVSRFLQLLADMKPLLETEDVFLFPDVRFQEGYYFVSSPEVLTPAFRLDPRDLNSLPVVLSQAAVRAQIQETLSGSQCRFSGTSRLCLPYLEHIPPDVLMKVKADNPDAFEKFQMCLRDFIEAHSSRSETLFLDLVRKVDFEVRELQRQFEHIRRQRALREYEVAAGLLSVLLCLLLPPDAAKYLVPLLGSSSVQKGLSYIRSAATDFFHVENSDYYIAWKLHGIAER